MDQTQVRTRALELALDHCGDDLSKFGIGEPAEIKHILEVASQFVAFIEGRATNA